MKATARCRRSTLQRANGTVPWRKGRNDPAGLDGVRGIAFGNGLNQQPLNTLFYVAGPNKGVNGAYGRVDVQP